MPSFGRPWVPHQIHRSDYSSGGVCGPTISVNYAVVCWWRKEIPNLVWVFIFVSYRNHYREKSYNNHTYRMHSRLCLLSKSVPGLVFRCVRVLPNREFPQRVGFPIFIQYTDPHTDQLDEHLKLSYWLCHVWCEALNSASTTFPEVGLLVFLANPIGLRWSQGKIPRLHSFSSSPL